MTLRNFTFRPQTNLYPPHTSVRQYINDIITHWNLSPYIRLGHEVLEARWEGSPTAGHWVLNLHDIGNEAIFSAAFDHLISAVGHEHIPSEPRIQGSEEWAQSGTGREIIHSMYYRNPQDFKGKNVLMVGAGVSGIDISRLIVGHANSVRKRVCFSHVSRQRPSSRRHIYRSGRLTCQGCRILSHPVSSPWLKLSGLLLIPSFLTTTLR